MKTSRVGSMVTEMLNENCRTANSSQRKRIICRRVKSAFNHLMTNTDSSFSLCSFSTFICFQCDAFFFELGKEAKSCELKTRHDGEITPLFWSRRELSRKLHMLQWLFADVLRWAAANQQDFNQRAASVLLKKLIFSPHTITTRIRHTQRWLPVVSSRG